LVVRAGPYVLDFEHERPRRLQIAKVHSTGPERDIVFATFHGHLLVLKHDLTLLTDLGEPGIQDFVVHDDLSYAHAHTTSDRPITLLSQRGHLFSVTLNDRNAAPTSPPAELHCWTARIAGWGHDLESFDLSG